MSANNQTLIKKHGGMWFVFPNTNAESWEDYNEETGEWKEGNYLDLTKEDYRRCATREEAIKVAEKFENEDETEYGIVEEVLYTDGAKVLIR